MHRRRARRTSAPNLCSVHNDVLRRIIARISLDDLVVDLERRLQELPVYRDFEGEHTAALLRWNVDQFVRWLLDGTPPDLELLEGPIRDRLGAGMTMEDGLLIYRTAAQAGWDALVAAADDDERVALLSGADVLFGYMNAVTDVFYRAEVPTAEQRAHEQLERVLAGDVEGEFTLFVAVLEHASAGAHAALAAELRREGALAVGEGARTAGLLARPVSWPAAALVALGQPWTPAERPRRRRPPRRRARAERRRPRPRASSPTRWTTCAPSLTSRAGGAGSSAPPTTSRSCCCARSPRHARALAETVYGPLTAELARTLAALVEHGFDKSAAAAALPVHRNTLNYRAAKIEQLTGLDLASPADRGRAWLGTLAR